MFFKPSYAVTHRGGLTIVTASNPVLGTAVSVVMDADQHARFHRWLQGQGMIHEVLPDLTAEQREGLLSGIDPETWDDLFGEDVA
jgi:hypothetical protein